MHSYITISKLIDTLQQQQYQTESLFSLTHPAPLFLSGSFKLPPPRPPQPALSQSLCIGLRSTSDTQIRYLLLLLLLLLLSLSLSLSLSSLSLSLSLSLSFFISSSSSSDYWRAWANRKVWRWDLNWNNVGRFLRVTGSEFQTARAIKLKERFDLSFRFGILSSFSLEDRIRERDGS